LKTYKEKNDEVMYAKFLVNSVPVRRDSIRNTSAFGYNFYCYISQFGIGESLE